MLYPTVFLPVHAAPSVQRAQLRCELVCVFFFRIVFTSITSMIPIYSEFVLSLYQLLSMISESAYLPCALLLTLCRWRFTNSTAPRRTLAVASTWKGSDAKTPLAAGKKPIRAVHAKEVDASHDAGADRSNQAS